MQGMLAPFSFTLPLRHSCSPPSFSLPCRSSIILLNARPARPRYSHAHLAHAFHAATTFSSRLTVRFLANCGSASSATPSSQLGKLTCLRCGKLYQQDENGPQACVYHGHMTGDSGLYSFAPPHQGIDGEWTDESGVIVYKWNSRDDRPNTGNDNWKRRWSCCGVYEENAPACRRGWHISYDDGATRF